MKKRYPIFLLLTLAMLTLAACSPSANPTVNPAATAASAAVSDTPGALSTVVEPAATLAPTETAQPQQGKVLLVSSDAAAAKAIEPVLVELTSAAGLALETRTDLKPADLSPAARIVVLLTPPANLADLSALMSAGPQAQFLVFSTYDLPKTGSLSVIRQPAEFQAFLAGFVSTLLSTDYRAAGLLPSDGPLGLQLKDAFVNGGHYFCGVCAPGWPLRVYYPLTVDLPAASDGAAWHVSAVDLFDNQKVEVFYLAPEAMRPELLAYLRGSVQGDVPVRLLGAQPPPAELRAQWAATIRFDAAQSVRQLWPDLLVGKGGAELQAPLVLEDVNPRLLGDGRMRLVNELLEEIKAGRIYPYTVPAQ